MKLLNNKKILLLLLSVVTAFSVISICACNNSNDNNYNNDTVTTRTLTLQNYTEYLLIEYTYSYQQDTTNPYMSNVVYNVTVRSKNTKYTFSNCSITIKSERQLDSTGHANFSYSVLQSNLGGVYPQSPSVTAVKGKVVY